MIDRLMHHGEAMVIQGSSFRTKGEPPDEYHFHVITLLSQFWQRACRQAFTRDPAGFAAAAACLMRLLKLPA